MQRRRGDDVALSDEVETGTQAKTLDELAVVRAKHRVQTGAAGESGQRLGQMRIEFREGLAAFLVLADVDVEHDELGWLAGDRDVRIRIARPDLVDARGVSGRVVLAAYEPERGIGERSLAAVLDA